MIRLTAVSRSSAMVDKDQNEVDDGEMDDYAAGFYDGEHDS